ncbi:cytochrome c oxidase subunit II [Anaeromyxobacter diazotrophicus]|uniref:Cytochrome aa3 subunit 2 n=1 Tax=Anaeromyxobacter diazotrophicus TaxID=2590199 RepID=A0A7I9VKT5_9BACT|nr:cytochrome c oxidase subunit II [Anaeromyxobacter diazotrophicus]GEJ56788.1 hypothetical protein AMYX_15290 [Anaeromyxobacter diazotrophicus]
MRSPRPLAAAAAAAAALATRAAAAPAPERGYGLPRDVSLDGARVDELLHFTLLATVTIFVVVLGAMAFSFLRHGRAHPARYTHGSRRSVGVLVATVAVIAFGVDVTMFVRTLLDLNGHFWNFARAEEQPGAVRIEVNAHQWAWAVRYPSAQGEFNSADDVVTLNDVRVPAGVPVVIQLASTDVIHSFYLPNFRVKRDAVPGMINSITFQGREPGEYEIACAQHCGPNHYKMRGILTVLAPEDYRRWLETARADARRGYDATDSEAHWGWAWRKE